MSIHARSMLIAVDGPSGAGKGTLSKSLARAYKLIHLDTGLLFRAVGWKALQQNIPIQAEHEERLARLCYLIHPDELNCEELRLDTTASAASKVSVYPKVRAALLEYERQTAYCPPPSYCGSVLDGRDIGTTVCPDAPVKLFVTASAEVRARRRFDELSARGVTTSLASVLADLMERDARDSQRAAAPLAAAHDACVIDSSAMSPQDMLAAAMQRVQAAYPGAVPDVQQEE